MPLIALKLRNFLAIFITWGAVAFILGYALHGKIWELIDHAFGWG